MWFSHACYTLHVSSRLDVPWLRAHGSEWHTRHCPSFNPHFCEFQSNNGSSIGITETGWKRIIAYKLYQQRSLSVLSAHSSNNEHTITCRGETARLSAVRTIYLEIKQEGWLSPTERASVSVISLRHILASLVTPLKQSR